MTDHPNKRLADLLMERPPRRKIPWAGILVGGLVILAVVVCVIKIG